MGTPQEPRAGRPALERFLRDEIARRHRSIARFLKDSGYPNASFYRVVADSPAATSEMARHLEGALALPRYTLDYILDVNVPALRRAGLEPDQLRALEELLAPEVLTQDQEIGRQRRHTAG